MPPTRDVALSSKADPQFFTGSLWLMEFGALQVRVDVDGDRGKGEVAVPVNSYPQRRTLAMQRGLGIVLFRADAAAGGRRGEHRGCGGGRGETRSRLREWRGRNAAIRRIVMIVAAVLALVVVYLGNLWWTADARYHDRWVRTFQPQAIQAVSESGGQLELRLPAFGSVRGRGARTMVQEIIPDHGHLMHLFLIREPQMDRMFHLHPQRNGSDFTLQLPDMPAGPYHIFADVVDSSGFPWTFVGDIHLPQVNGGTMSGDDSEGATTPLAAAGTDSDTFVLLDHNRIVWERDASALRAERAGIVSVSHGGRSRGSSSRPLSLIWEWRGTPNSCARIFPCSHTCIPPGRCRWPRLIWRKRALPGSSLVPNGSGDDDARVCSCRWRAKALPAEVLVSRTDSRARGRTGFSSNSSITGRSKRRQRSTPRSMMGTPSWKIYSTQRFFVNRGMRCRSINYI